jgi:hypothetical protein
VIVAVSVVVGVVGVSGVEAAPPTPFLDVSAQYGARWLAARYDPAGFVPTATNTPNISATLQDTVALMTAHVEQATFDRAMTWLAANVDTVIDGGATGDDPARIGYLLILTDGAGLDPRSFGGVDLPARLLATLGAYEPGLFGGADPTYDGAYRQGIAITGLEAAGGGVPAAARDWLLDQQCDDTVPAAEGGWQAYRADLGQPCSAPDPNTFTGADTNSTALAIWALYGPNGWTGPVASADAAFEFLDRSQSSDGGFPYVAGAGSDPNSTGLVILSIVKVGMDPTTGRWAAGTPSPTDSLLSWQVGCDADPADQGAFASPFSSGLPDPIATSQAVWGIAGRPFPQSSQPSWEVAPVPCLPPTTTSTTDPTTTSSTTAAPTTSTTVATSPVAPAVVTQPRLAG